MTRILVTGGGKGVGAAIVRALVTAGHDVDFTYRSSGESAKALADELMGAHEGRQVAAHALDLAERRRSKPSAPGSRARPSSASCTMPASPMTRSPP